MPEAPARENAAGENRWDDGLAVDAALDTLGQEDPRAAELVKLRYYAALTLPETAAVLGVSTRLRGRPILPNASIPRAASLRTRRGYPFSVDAQIRVKVDRPFHFVEASLLAGRKFRSTLRSLRPRAPPIRLETGLPESEASIHPYPSLA